MCAFPQKLCGEALAPGVEAFEVGPLEGDRVTWCHEGETLTKVSPYKKRKRFPTPYVSTKERPHEHTRKVLLPARDTRNVIDQSLDLGLPASRTVGIKCLLVKPHRQRYLVIATQAKTADLSLL